MKPFEARTGDEVRKPDGTVLTVVAYDGAGRLHCRSEPGAPIEELWPDELQPVAKPAPKQEKKEPFVW